MAVGIALVCRSLSYDMCPSMMLEAQAFDEDQRKGDEVGLKCTLSAIWYYMQHGLSCHSLPGQICPTT